MSAGDLLVVAGEASGDQHGARMLRELNDCDPASGRSASGPDELASEGVELLADSHEISVVGISEAISRSCRAPKRSCDLAGRGLREAPARRPPF